MNLMLYGFGGIAIAGGIILVIPAASNISHPSDVLIVLGAPIVMNGVFLFICGAVLMALGKTTALLTGIAEKLSSYDGSGGKEKAHVRCPQCSQQLRVPVGKTGMLSCPKCSFKFEVKT